MSKESEAFACPHTPCRGCNGVAEMAISHNMQDLSCRISILVGLHSNGKVPTDKALEQIDALYSQFRVSVDELKKSGL